MKAMPVVEIVGVGTELFFVKRIPARKLISRGFYSVEMVDNGRLNLLRGIPTRVSSVEDQTINLHF